MKAKMGATELVELGRKRCKPGTVLRKTFTYVRAGKRVRVSAACVPDRGAPGKTPASKQWSRGIPELKQQFLPGWEAQDSAEKRMAAIKKNVDDKGCLEVSRRLTVIRNLNARQNPDVARKAKSDREKAVQKSWCKLKSKGR